MTYRLFLICTAACAALAAPAADAAMTWQRVSTLNPSIHLHGIAWGNGRFVAVGTSPSALGTVLTSDNGIDWTPRPQPPIGSGVGLDIVWNGSQWVAIGHRSTPTSEPFSMVSTDNGDTWTTPLGWGVDNAAVLALAWKSGLMPHHYLAVGQSITPTEVRSYGSVNGFDWNDGTIASPGSLRTLLWDGGKFVAAGDFGTILTSFDGNAWTAQTSGTTAHLMGSTVGGSTHLIVGTAGWILRSVDGGTNWSAETSGVSVQLSDVAWNGNIFVAVGQNNTILSSPDGIAWHQQPVPPPLGPPDQAQLNDIVWGGNRWVAVGNLGEILYSDDTTPVELQSFTVD